MVAISTVINRYKPSEIELNAARNHLQLDRYADGSVDVPKRVAKRSPEARDRELKSLMNLYEGACADVKSILPKRANTIRVVSFNVHSWNDYRQGPYRQSEKEFEDILALIKAVNPDVIGLQEMMYSDEHRLEKFCEALDIPRKNVVFEKGCIGVHGCENPDNNVPSDLETGNVIASRYPIENRYSNMLTEGRLEGETEPAKMKD